jgi:hypothetical protein
MGWRFIRIRGTRFYRDPDATMNYIFEELHRLEIGPITSDSIQIDRDDVAEELKTRIIRRAWEIMREQSWVFS